MLGANLKNAILEGNESKALSIADDISDLNFRIRSSTKKGFDGIGAPILHLAILNEMSTLAKKIVDKLLANDSLGFALLEKDNLGRTALHLSTGKSNLQLSQYLLERNPNLREIGDNKGNTPIHYAAKMDNVFHLKLFFSEEFPLCEVDKLNNMHQSPLHLAAVKGNNAAVNFLLSQNASKKTFDSEAYTPSDVAFVKHREVSNQLKVQKTPSLLTLTGLKIQSDARLKDFVKTHETQLPYGLSQTASDSANREQEHRETVAAIEGEKVRQRLETIEKLQKRIAALKLN